MSGPWEKYASTPDGDGPWSKYAAPVAEAPSAEPPSPLRFPEDMELSTAEKAALWFDQQTGGAASQAGAAARGFVRGAAKPTVGAYQLASRLVHGASGPVDAAIAGQDAKDKALGYGTGNEILGSLASPASVGTMKLMPIYRGAQGVGGMVGQVARNMTVGGTAGGAFGAMEPVTDTTQAPYGQQKLDQINTGLAIGTVASPVVTALGYGTGKIISGITDAVKGNLSKLRAAELFRKVAGPQTDAIRFATTNAPANTSPGQHLVEKGVLAPEVQALGRMADGRTPAVTLTRATDQASARNAAIQAVTPDEVAAVAARDAASKVTYGKAFASDKQRLDDMQRTMQAAESSRTGGIGGFSPPAPVMTAEISALQGNPAIVSAAKEAAKLAATKGENIGNPLTSLRGLHYIKLAIDNQFKNRSASTALQNYSDDALNSTKQQLLQAIEGTTNQPGLSPLYGLARQQYANMSPEVNQAQILNQLMTELKKPGGGERPLPFLKSLTTGENALIKRSGGNPRFGGIEDALNPNQMGVVRDVERQFVRDAEVKLQQNAGMQNLSSLVSDGGLRARLPSFFNKWVTAANKGLDIAESGMNKKTITSIAEGMQSGKSLNELLNTIPLWQKQKVLSALVKDSGRAAIPVTTGITTAAQQ